MRALEVTRGVVDGDAFAGRVVLEQQHLNRVVHAVRLTRFNRVQSVKVQLHLLYHLGDAMHVQGVAATGVISATMQDGAPRKVFLPMIRVDVADANDFGFGYPTSNVVLDP